MMTQYQIVPYGFKVHLPRQPSETRELGDLDGRGTSFLDFAARCASSYVDNEHRESGVAATSFEVDEVRREDQTTVIVVSPGTRGIKSKVRQRRAGTTTNVEVLEEDTTSIPLRHVLFVEPMAKMGILLVERAGHAGAVTLFNKVLTTTLSTMLNGLALKVEPIMSTEAMEAWAQDARVRSVTLEHTDRSTGESSRKLHGLPFGTVITFKAPRKRTWSLLNFGGLKEMNQFGILTTLVPELPDHMSSTMADLVAEEMLDGGWTVALDLQNGQTRRKFAVGTKSGVTLTFPVGEASALARPTDEEFMEACRSALVELDQMSAVSVPSAQLCTWPAQPWDHAKDTWKAVWGVPESKSP